MKEKQLDLITSRRKTISYWTFRTTSATEPEWLSGRSNNLPDILRRLIEGAKSDDLPTVILFLDFRKAFDSRHRGTILRILKAYGIPEELVNAIAKMYENTQALVPSPDGETDWFEITARVLQGDALAPHLFAIVFDYTMRQALKAHMAILPALRLN